MPPRQRGRRLRLARHPDYFSSATQIGLTATPKETKDVSNIHYFGEPVYTYSLRQGIEDGYLAPYKVIRVDLDKDTFGWRPTGHDRQARPPDRRPHLQPAPT
jgi:type I restriction enzyme R subunit